MSKSSYCAPWWAGALVAASATFAVQSNAHAQSCESDADCGAGFTCRTETYESCYGGWDCTPEGCEPVDEVCETYESSWCANATCASDADCPSFMACAPQTTWVCDGGGSGGSAGGSAGTGAAGASGEPADAGFMEPSHCEEVPADSLCIPRYDLPCETASDCGGGFDCVETYYWMCSGGTGGAGGIGGTGGVGGGPEDAGVADESDGGGDDFVCEQVPSGSNACQLQDLPCGADADCPAGLACLEQYIYGPCTGGMGGIGGGAGTSGTGGIGGGEAGIGGGPADGGFEEPIECPEPEVQQRCMPPSYGGGGSGGAGGMSGGAGTGGGDSDAGVEEPGGAGGAAGMSAAGAGGETGGEDDEADEHDGRGRGRGLLKRLLRGCSAGGPASGGSAGWLMLGVAALALRRRARRS